MFCPPLRLCRSLSEYITAICNSGIRWFFYFDIASNIHGLDLAKQKFRNINKVVYQELNYTRSGGGNDHLRS